MEAFQKSHLKKAHHHKHESLYDDYERQIKSTTKKNQQIEKQTLTELSTSKQIINFFGRGYAFLIVGMCSTALIYPASVRLVKFLGVKSFFNVHFAIIPIIANVNALILGSVQGYFNYKLFESNYPIVKDQEITALESRL